MKAAIAGLALLPLAGLAASPAPAQTTGERISRIIVYGNDPCPRGEGGEIVVCARRPESDRYRVPEPFRGPDPNAPDNMSWAVRAQSLEYVGRSGIQSCSTVGPGGSTGCWNQLMRRAREENSAAPVTTPPPPP